MPVRDAQYEFHSAAQARAWAGGDFDADRRLAFDGVGARPDRGGGGGCARTLADEARGPAGVEAAAVRAPVLVRLLVPKKEQ
jgi:hypothetical protein